MAGIFSQLFGGGSKANSSTDTNSTTTQSNQTNQTQNQTGSQQSTQTQTTLDPNTIAILQQLVPQLAQNIGGGANDAGSIRAIAQQLTAASTNTGTDAAISAQQAEATRAYNQGEGQQIAGIQQQIGSKGNSFSQLLQQSGSSDLQTQLLNIVAQSKLAENQQSIGALEGAGQAYGQAGQTDVSETAAPLQNFLAAIGALKGATTTGSSDTSSLESIISQILQTGTQNTTGTSNTTGTQSTTPGIVGGLQQLFSGGNSI